MVAQLQPEQDIFASLSEATPLAFLLRRGLDYVQQGHCSEAGALFASVREQLSPAQVVLIDLLDAFLHEYADYKCIERTLHEASMHFATAHLELQARIATFGTVLSAIIKDVAAGDQCSNSLHNERERGLPSLHSVPAGDLQGTPPAIGATLISENVPLAPLSITCFGHFGVWRSGKPISLCSNRSGQRILRFLVSQPGRNATSDTLQTMLWPEDETEVASKKLYFAISALRRSLNDGPASEPSRSYIVCKNRVYSLNASVAIQTDVDEFLHCYRMGQQRSAERVALYERACQLYTGPFLPEDIYADWSFIQREQLTQAYLAMRNRLTEDYLKVKRYEDATQSAHAVLKENRCDEVAHRHLIQVYLAQGRRSEARQQYQRCERALREELGVKPLPETTLAIQELLNNDPPSTQQ
ncbi:MAG TPA: BTAD domain-containing putative transcriptional regulator [Ktedonobacteraceae bacterium]